MERQRGREREGTVGGRLEVRTWWVIVGARGEESGAFGLFG